MPQELFLWEVTKGNAIDEVAVASVNLIDWPGELPESILFCCKPDMQMKLFIQDPRDANRYVRMVGDVCQEIPQI